jgi:hypothetical protein
MIYEKVESRLVENCCEASFFLKFQISDLKNCRIFKISNFRFENCQMSILKNCQFFEISNFRLEKLLNFQNFKFQI